MAGPVVASVLRVSADVSLGDVISMELVLGVVDPEITKVTREVVTGAATLRDVVMPGLASVPGVCRDLVGC